MGDIRFRAELQRRGPAAAVVLDDEHVATVAAWEVLAGPAPDALVPVASAPPSGFETKIALGAVPGYYAVSALSTAGDVLATTDPTSVSP